ncbi:MAG: STAS domain-containing protein [candidate division Zixibacteria bacterium]|nr:STAS domain-containing protein [candidate division Zixibacteria bacterium]
MTDTAFAQNKYNENTVIIDVGKQLDNNNAHEMVEIISNAQSQGHKYIVLDMHQLEFISSAGVGSILGTIESSREIGGDIILSNASDAIMQVLEVLDLAEYLTIKSDDAGIVELCGTKG